MDRKSTVATLKTMAMCRSEIIWCVLSIEESVLKIAINEGYLAETLKIKSPGKVVLRKMLTQDSDQ